MFSLHIDTARTWRGGQQQALLTVLGLRARGHRAVLVAHPEGELYRRAAEGSDLVPLSPTNEVDLATAWKLSRIIRQWKPEIVHAHDPHAVAMAGLALSFGAPTPRPRLVASRRVDFHLQGHSFSQWKYRQVDGFIAASDAIRDILIHDRIDPARIVVVHDGIDVERIERLPAVDIHAEYWLPRGAPVVVNVGALVGHKGQRHLVDAVSLVMRDLPDVHVIVFGEGELRAPLEKQIKHLGLDKRVLLPGFREDVLSLVKSADLFVMSSVTEGLGSAVLDAMAMGLAVVGTRAGGIPEAVVHGETGLLVETGDAQPLASAIVRLLKDPKLRRAYGDAGRHRVREHFGVDRLVDGTLAAYSRFARQLEQGSSSKAGHVSTETRKH
ncbi:MAG: glycosyltransferase [Vicinamibacterales bacterium]